MIGALPLPDPLLLLRAQANFAAASPRASPPILLPPPFPPTAWTQLAAFSGDALGRPDGRPGRRVPRVYPNGALGADMTGWPSGFRAAGETPVPAKPAWPRTKGCIFLGRDSATMFGWLRTPSGAGRSC